MVCEHEASIPSLLRLNQLQLHFLRVFSKADNQHPHHLFLSHLLSSFEKLFQFYNPGLPSFPFYEVLEGKRMIHPFFFYYFFQVGGSFTHGYLLLASIAPLLLAPAVSLMPSLPSPRGLFIFIYLFHGQSLILGFLVKTPQPSSSRSKAVIRKVNEKFSLHP